MRKEKIDEERNAKRERYLALNKDYKETFGTPAGMRVLDDILGKGSLWSTTCHGNIDGKDGFREGKRDHALYILKRVNVADSNIIINMMRDNQRLKLEREIK